MIWLTISESWYWLDTAIRSNISYFLSTVIEILRLSMVSKPNLHYHAEQRYGWAGFFNGKPWHEGCTAAAALCEWGTRIGAARFTAERHWRWEGWARRGLRERRQTHAPADTDTRSRRGRQPVRTPREGCMALQEDRQPYTLQLHPPHHHQYHYPLLPFIFKVFYTNYKLSCWQYALNIWFKRNNLSSCLSMQLFICLDYNYPNYLAAAAH